MRLCDKCEWGKCHVEISGKTQLVPLAAANLQTLIKTMYRDTSKSIKTLRIFDDLVLSGYARKLAVLL